MSVLWGTLDSDLTRYSLAQEVVHKAISQENTTTTQRGMRKFEEDSQRDAEEGGHVERSKDEELGGRGLCS